MFKVRHENSPYNVWVLKEGREGRQGRWLSESLASIARPYCSAGLPFYIRHKLNAPRISFVSWKPSNVTIGPPLRPSAAFADERWVLLAVHQIGQPRPSRHRDTIHVIGLGPAPLPGFSGHDASGMLQTLLVTTWNIKTMIPPSIVVLGWSDVLISNANLMTVLMLKEWTWGNTCVSDDSMKVLHLRWKISDFLKVFFTKYIFLPFMNP